MTRERMFRVLMISPHFPPDTGAGTHRVRLLAPHLPKYGWEPTIVTVDPRDYEGRLDAGLADLVPEELRVVRCRAWPARWTRRIGVGDLGLRALRGLWRASAELLQRERFDCVFITIYPTYPALLGPLLKKRFGIPFVLDYQDPWVGAWGRTVGGGPNGKPDLKSRVTRAAAKMLEPRAARAAGAITAVSRATFEQIQARYPGLEETLAAEIPLGGEPSDFDRLRRDPKPNPHFDPNDGQVHLCYVGTLLPLGFETLRAFFRALGLMRDRRPELYRRLRVHFFGTSNQTDPGAPERVLPVARELGVEQQVTETAPRIDYLDALTVQIQATAILLLGSSEPHYTASKLYPALLSERPILALLHAASNAVGILGSAVRPPTARLVTYDDSNRAQARVEAIDAELSGLVESPVYDRADVRAEAIGEYTAQSLAGRLARVLDRARSRA